MTQRIGLEAVFEDKAFQSGVDRYNRAIDTMVGKTTTGASGMGAQFAGLGTKVLGLAGLMGGALVAGIGAAGVAMGSFVADGIQKAMSFEAQLDGIQAVLGATGDEISALGDLIIDLGLNPNLKVDATQAAEAIDMLARNGLSATEILEGAAEATVLLANATGAEFGTAANIATDSMAIFNIEAGDMVDAVNGITSVTVASKFGVEDYALALAQAGGVAASSGVEFNDFNTSIAAISPLFASGSDAGTSFKTMLQRLVPSTEKAEDLMRELGIITEETGNRFFDSEGNLKSMNEIAVIINETFADMSEEQRNAAMSTLFGTDAMRAAVGIMDSGAIAYTDAATAAAELGVSVEDVTGFLEGGITQYEAMMITMGQTDALESAATRMDNLSGAMEILGGVVDAIKLQVGNTFLPLIRQVVDAVTGFLSENQDTIVSFFTSISSAISEFVTSITEGQSPITAFFDALAAGGVPEETITQIQDVVTSIQDFIDKIVTFVNDHAEAFKGALIGIGAVLGSSVIVAVIGGIIAALTALATPLTAIIAAAALLGAAWSENWFGIRDTVTQAWADFQPTLQTIKDWLEVNIPKAVDTVTTAFTSISTWFNDNKQTILDFISSVIDPVKEAWTETGDAVGGLATGQFAKISDWFKENKPLIEDFARVIGTVLVGAAAILAKVWSVLQVQLAKFTQIVAVPFLDDLVTHFLNVATLIMQVVTGDWAGAWESVKTIVSDSVGNLIDLITNLGDWIAGWFGSSLEEIGTIWSGIWDNVTAIVSLAWEAVTTAITTAWTNIQTWWDGVVATFTAGWQAFWDGLFLTITTIWTAITTYINDAITSFSTGWTAFWDGISLTITTIWEAIKTYITDAITGLFESMGLSLDDMHERWSTIWNDVGLIAQTVWDLIVSWVGEKLLALQTAITTVTTAIQAWWSTTWTAISAAASAIWDAIVLYITTKITEAQTTLTTIVTAIQTWWDTTWNTIKTTLETVWNAITEYVNTKVTEVQDKVETIIGEVKEWWDEHWGLIRDKLQDIWDEIHTAIETKLNEIKTIIEEKITEAKNWIGDQVDKFKGVGEDVILGIRDGILAQAGAVLEAITGVVEDAISWAKSLLGIASPSKVFEDVGTDVIAGMIEGILSGRDGLESAMGDAIGPIIEFGNKLGSFGSTIAGRFKAEVLDPMKDNIDALEDEVTGRQDMLRMFQGGWAQSLGMDLEEFLTQLPQLTLAAAQSGDTKFLQNLQTMRDLQGEINESQGELNAATKQYETEQKKILELEKQRQDLAFLKQQLDLLNTIREAGLNPADILNGMQLGLDASLPDLMNAMTTAMSAIVGAANDELQIASPSKVFRDIGYDILNGLAKGLQKVDPVVTAVGRMSAAVVDTTVKAMKELSSQANLVYPTLTRAIGYNNDIAPLQTNRPFTPSPVVNVDAAAPQYNATFNTRQSDVTLNRAFRLMELSRA